MAIGGGCGAPPPATATSKVVKAVPKVDAEGDAKSGVQKFRVKLLAESGGQSTIDVLYQIGLDGIRTLDPNTSRTLRIYPLENITRCDKFNSITFAFWSKSSVDVKSRRITLQSNCYTINTLLDTVTAATIQCTFKAQLFNAKLSKELDSLNRNFPNSRNVFINVYDPLLDIISSYQKYGYKVGDTGCCGTGRIEVATLCNRFDSICPNVHDYVFWDSFHPTESVYKRLISSILQKYVYQFK